MSKVMVDAAWGVSTYSEIVRQRVIKNAAIAVDKELTDGVKEALGDGTSLVVDIDGKEVPLFTISVAKGRVSYNVKGLIADLKEQGIEIDLEKYTIVGQESRRLMVVDDAVPVEIEIPKPREMPSQRVA